MNENTIKDSLSSSYHRFVKRGLSGITASSRVLPDFIISGTVRSGTTSLYYNICEHPSVLPASYDEIGFFDSNYHLGINWYRSMFPTEKEMKQVKKETNFAITGEDTPFYFWKKEAAERIFQDIPNSKIIIIFRNPVDRAYSNYNLGIRKKTESLSFEDAIDEEMNFLKTHSFRDAVDRRRSYLSKGLYENQIKIWLDNFPREQIHILCTEDMKKNPKESLLKIFQFLGIPNYTLKNPQKQKLAEYKKMDDKTREKLLTFYEPYNQKFFETIQEKFDWDF
jgi:hypothetical protein